MQNFLGNKGRENDARFDVFMVVSQCRRPQLERKRIT